MTSDSAEIIQAIRSALFEAVLAGAHPDHTVSLQSGRIYLDDVSFRIQEAAEALLKTLEKEGYVVAKPFWPPEEIERAINAR